MEGTTHDHAIRHQTVAKTSQALRLSSSTASAHVLLESCEFHPAAPILWRVAVLGCWLRCLDKIQPNAITARTPASCNDSVTEDVDVREGR